VYAVFLLFCFLLQLASVFCSLEMRNEIDQEENAQTLVASEFSQYDPNDANAADVVAKWDHIQRKMRCCGGFQWGTGYEAYRGSPIGNRHSIPNSCCHEKDSTCGDRFFRKLESNSDRISALEKVYR